MSARLALIDGAFLNQSLERPMAMSLDVKSDEPAIYAVMSKIAGGLFLEFNKQLIAAVQQLPANVGSPGQKPGGALESLVDRYGLGAEERELLTKVGTEEVHRVWKKHLESIDYSLAFRPRIEKPVEGLAVLAVPGEKIKVEAFRADGSLSTLEASFEIEINLGVIRGKVSW